VIDVNGPIRPFYDGWQVYNDRLIEAIQGLSDEQLKLRPGPDQWPIWAIAGHMAGMRAYWLCGVFGEPGAETTPFVDFMTGLGWEDDEATPRSADELVGALTSTWGLVESCLDRWTPETLGVTATVELASGPRVHTRQSVIMRMISHDAYHCGEISQILGMNGRPAINLWSRRPA
jgi:uncharacterized damage-inducible protein DinB